MEIETPTTDDLSDRLSQNEYSPQTDCDVLWPHARAMEKALRASLKYEEARFETIRYQCFTEIPKRLEGWTDEGIREQLEEAESKWCKVFINLRSAALGIPDENV